MPNSLHRWKTLSRLPCRSRYSAPAWGVGLVLCSACQSSSPNAEPSLPERWNEQVALQSAVDLDPAERVVKVELEARVHRVEIAPGHSVEAWTYAGSSPGPVLRAKVGDTLRVHFTNNLPEATTIHWHGVEVPAAQDGPGLPGTEIEPGKSFDYEFKLLHSGTYWYHPHLNSAEQVWRGLYGALIVDSADEPDFGQELILLLHDVELDESTRELAPAAAQGDLGRFFGHEGHTLLVNGRVAPTIRVYPGSTLRMRVINTSISRYYRLAIDGHTLTRIAGDSELVERPQQRNDVLLVPGERAELMVTAQGAPNTQVKVRSLPYNRFICEGCDESDDLFSIALEQGAGTTRTAPASFARIEPIDISMATRRDLIFGETTRNGITALAINGRVHGQDTLTIEAHAGATEQWVVKNESDYDHPFHLHGFRFQVLEQSGLTPPVREWKDTVNIAARTQMRMAVQFDDRAGMWMFHCHILDHAEIGMMGMLHLLPM